MYLRDFIIRQRKFGAKAFGPGRRRAGICDHLRKEIKEVEDGNGDPKEWTDVCLLAIDGLSRHLMYDEDGNQVRTEAEAAMEAISYLIGKLAENEQREWPDWRTAPKDKAIEHIRR